MAKLRGTALLGTLSCLALILMGQVSGVPSGTSAMVSNPPLGHAADPIGVAAVEKAISSAVPAWTNLTYGPSPSPRSDYGMAYDSADRLVLLFGGMSPSGVALNDTWTYSAGVWTNITASVGPAPSPRYGVGMTYDAGDGYVLLYGGVGPVNGANQFFAQTWTFAGSHWTELNSSGVVPSTTSPEDLLAYDSTGNYTLLAGGTSYEFRAGVWVDVSFNRTTNTSYSGPSNCAATVDYPVDGGILCVGEATWLFNGSWSQAQGWTNLTPAITGSPPMNREWPAVTYDPSQGCVVLFGGGVYVQTSLGLAWETLGDTWTLRNSTWSNVSSGSSPPSTSRAALIWDATDNMTLLFGGFGASEPGSNWVFANSTWSWGATPLLIGVTPIVRPSPIDVGAQAAFSVTFLGGVMPINYSWRFGDGSGGSSPNPTHVYAAPGMYNVSVWVNDSASHSGEGELTLEVIPAGSIGLLSSPNPTDVGVPVMFSVNPVGGTGSYRTEWVFGDGSHGTGNNSSHAFASSGNFTVRAWLNDTGGGSANASLLEHVNPALSAPVISAAPNPPSLGQLVNFSATVTGGTAPYSYSWSFGDGGTGGNLTNISHIFTTNGPFTAGVTVHDAAGAVKTGSIDLTVALNLSILANATAGAAPLAIGFNSQVSEGTPPYAYRWQFGDGSTSGLASPSHRFVDPGFYSTVLTVTDASGHSAQAQWTVMAAPDGGGPLSAGLVATPTAVPIGNSTLVTASLSGGIGKYTWVWESKNISCSATGFLSERCTPSQAGSATITLTLRDAVGHQVTGLVIVQSGPPTESHPGSAQEAPWFATPYTLVLIVGSIMAMAVAASLLTRRSRRTPQPDHQAGSYPEYHEAMQRPVASDPRAPNGNKAKAGTQQGAADETRADPLEGMV